MIDDLNSALDELERRIGEPVDGAQLARIALTSEHHFRRMFASLAGVGLAEYVKRRRMTLAAADVVHGHETLLEIAARFGYTSADAFSRAFREVHGITPSAAREPGARLRSQPQLSFRLTIDGSTDMEYRTVELDRFTVIGRAARMPLVHFGPNRKLAAFVASVPREETEALKQLGDVEPHGVLAICTDFADSRADGSEFTYVHGVATSVAGDAAFDRLDVDAGTWLVLTPADGSDAALQALWPYAFTEWFPAHRYSLAAGPEIVTMRVGSEGLERELWLPIRRG